MTEKKYEAQRKPEGHDPPSRSGSEPLSGDERDLVQPVPAGRAF